MFNLKVLAQTQSQVHTGPQFRVLSDGLAPFPCCCSTCTVPSVETHHSRGSDITVYLPKQNYEHHPSARPRTDWGAWFRRSAPSPAPTAAAAQPAARPWAQPWIPVEGEAQTVMLWPCPRWVQVGVRVWLIDCTWRLIGHLRPIKGVFSETRQSAARKQKRRKFSVYYYYYYYLFLHNKLNDQNVFC